MNLYLVKRDHNNGWPDQLMGIVVAARFHDEARGLAAANAGDEGASTWKDGTLSSCTMIAYNVDMDSPEVGVILRDFWEA